MPSIETSRRRDRYLLAAITAPAFLGIVASLWPFEPIALLLTCTLLAFCTIAPCLLIRSRRQLFAGIATIATLLSVATLNWPLRAAYVLSRPSLDRIAAEVQAGELPVAPCTIGLFRVRKAEMHPNGVVCLWTNDDPAGRTGFVQTEASDLPFNLWSHTSLDNSWQFISED